MLYVEPLAIDDYASQIGRARDDDSAVSDYLRGYSSNAPFVASHALNFLVGSSLSDAITAATDKTFAVFGVLDDSERGLRAGAAYYRKTDQASAARIDATFPGRTVCLPGTAVQGEVVKAGGTPSFTDPREPTGRLTPVGDVEYSHPLAFLDNISLSNWALKGFEYVLGVNPLDEAMKFFAGDWQHVAKAAVAFNRAADALDDLAFNVQYGANATQSHWRGNAADSAYQHFTNLANGVDGLVDPLRQISKNLSDIARSVWSACDAVAGLIKSVVDAAIVAGIAAAAGTVAAESIFGAIAGYGIAGLAACRMVMKWDEATGLMTELYEVGRSTTSTISALVSRLRSSDLPQLSGLTAYSHPAAPPPPRDRTPPKLFGPNDILVDPNRPWTVTTMPEGTEPTDPNRPWTVTTMPEGAEPTDPKRPWTVSTMPEGTKPVEPAPADRTPPKLFGPDDLFPAKTSPQTSNTG